MSIKQDLSDRAIAELKSIYSTLNHNYDQVKVKILTFLGAGLAIMTYLYSGGDLFFPEQVYGMIFYCAGLGLTLTALVILFTALLPVTWYYATELKDLKVLAFKDTEEMSLYVRDEYISTIERNIESYEKKQKLLAISSYMLIIGAIILVILKHFGG